MEQLTPLNKQVTGYESYQSALTHKDVMSKQLTSLDIGNINPESYMHPLFIGLAEIFDSTPQTAKYRLLLATFTLIELLGTLFFAIGSLFSGQREFTLQDLQAMEAQQYELKKDLGY